MPIEHTINMLMHGMFATQWATDMNMQVPWSDLPPEFASKGDMFIELDCGSKLTTHSAFMAHASSVLAEAIDLAPQPASGNELRVPVKCVSKAEATLLLQVRGAVPQHCSCECIVVTENC